MKTFLNLKINEYLLMSVCTLGFATALSVPLVALVQPDLGLVRDIILLELGGLN